MVGPALGKKYGPIYGPINGKKAGRALGKKYSPIYGPIYGQAAVENQTGIFAEGGAGRPKFTPEDDTFIFSNVLQDVQFSSQRSLEDGFNVYESKI